jgi:hypothetical protein
MRLGSIGKVASIQSGSTPFDVEPAPIEHAAAGRTLVALTPAASASPVTFRQATFLAQLLAMKDQHPQTRERRRVEPSEAIAAYRATAALLDR